MSESRQEERSAWARPDGYMAWVRTARPHYALKSLLVFVPLLTTHQFTAPALGDTLIAALVFCLAAASGYFVNDVIDAAVDRRHPINHGRPIAAGQLRPREALAAALLLFALSLSGAALMSWQLAAVILGYGALGLAYDLYLKRVIILDIICLATFHTLRILAGAVALQVSLSEWLFAFSMFIFAALGFTKRYVEVTRYLEPQGGGNGRGYAATDAPMIAILAAGIGLNAVTIFALYLSAPTTKAVYSHLWLLWLACPVILFWFCRLLLLAHRGKLSGDPVLFAITDRVSLVTGIALTLLVILAR